MANIRVRYQNKKIYIRFYFKGVRYEEYSGLMCGLDGRERCRCKGCKTARSIGAEIESKKNANTFTFKDYFPESEHSQDLAVAIVDKNSTFYDFATNVWLPTKDITYSTLRGYKKLINNVTKALSALNTTKIKEVTHSHFAVILKSWQDEGKAVKTIKNNLTLAKEIFRSAVSNNLASKNPLAEISIPQVKKVEKRIPKEFEGKIFVSEMDDELEMVRSEDDKAKDPFTEKEIKLILDDLKTNDEHWAAFFAIGFFAGLRTGEIMALTWHDISLKSHLIHVHQTQTEGRHKDTTKTRKDYYAHIIVDLDSFLYKHKELNFSKGKHLFYNHYNRPIANYKTVTLHWYKCLERVGLRSRIPYQTRHTFATMMLARGVDHNWIREQLGHQNLNMLYNTYGNFTRTRSSAEHITLYAGGRINLLLAA
jgi:integrase